MLGGGGYVLPRYLERNFPKGTVDVVEIDPGVTKAAFAAFELDPDTKINTINLDARNYIDALTEQSRRGQSIKQYDFIYEDALDHYTIPWQLTTKEFNDKLYKLLADDGIYMVELIEAFDSGLFLGAYINTLEQTFPFVAVLSQSDVKTWDRNTFVVVATKRKLALADVCRDFEIDRVAWYLDDSQIAQLRGKAKGMLLTDDYAPVEILTAPVYLRNVEFRAPRLSKQAQKYASQGNFAKTMKKLEAFAAADPSVCVRAYSTIALVFDGQGRTEDAIKIFKSAIERFNDAKYKDQMPQLLFNYAAVLKKRGDKEQASEKFGAAVKICNELVSGNPNLVEPYRVLGNVFAENGDFVRSAEYFRKAVDLEPDNPENFMNLTQAFEAGNDLDSAIRSAQKAVEHFQMLHRSQDVENFKNYLQQMQVQRPDNQ
ncbi:MAG: fused MFS/spermidine synthase [Sedimentisphaerales bacterium]|nr:fused MFS/spermidine synthase [Sedimentisphaerales bacterium]